jgi:hypothetical protein
MGALGEGVPSRGFRDTLPVKQLALSQVCWNGYFTSQC